MLLLTSISDLLRLTPSAATAVHVQASWVDNNAGTITPGRTNTILSAATIATVVGSPTASTNRNIKQLTARAQGGANTLILTHTDGATAVELVSVALSAGESLVFTDGLGFEVLTASGQIKGTGGVSTGALPANLFGVAAQGVATTFLRTDDTLPLARASAPADLRGWSYIGEVTASAAVRTGTLSWAATFAELHFEYNIAGYSGAAIGRLIVGPTAGLSETGTTFCSNLIEGVTQNTTSVSVPGWPLAVTAAAVPRYGWMRVKNIAASIKLMNGRGQHSGTVPTVVPVSMIMDGMFNDATNSIQKAELAVYALITGATISATTFNAGTYLRAWGRNND